ncbi:MAG: hypothetical protein WBC30_17445 [Candidatus Sulfotelmatobacter sp.]
MHSRTYTALLGLGFDTDLIARIGAHGHTVSALRSLSNQALQLNYSQSDVALIQERIRRAAIRAEVVDAVLEASDRVCCFCRDGISSRPFQIHHAVEYSKTQDNSFNNLILICPNHHQTIPKTQTAEQQKQARAEWYALASVVRSYRNKGIAFPFGSFVGLDYGSEPDPLALIDGYKLSNATALDLAQTTFAQNAMQRLERSPFLAIAGQSGSGKSTFARGVIGQFWKNGFAAFQYQPLSHGQAAAEVLTFLSLADRNSILLLDDVNVYLSEIDITAIQTASRVGAKVVCTWTREGAGAPTLERHLPDWMLIDWDQLRPSVHRYLLQHETTLAPAIGRRQGNVVGRVGLGHMDQRLERYITDFEANAKSVSEFVFLLRGGDEIVQRELDVLTSGEHSEIPVLTLAIEQIAGFENMLTPDQVVEQCARAGVTLKPPISAAWVNKVLRNQVGRGRVRESRGYFTTIHRDWAARLIDRALASNRSYDAVNRLLLPEFDFASVAPQRCMRLCSWLWYLPTGGKWIKERLATKTAEDWSVLVGRAAARDLGVLGFVAERMHLLFPSPDWGRTVAAAFERHESTLRALLRTGTPKTWPALKSLSWTIETANPSLASRLWSSPENDPKTVAELLEGTHPDYYETVSWYFGSVRKQSPEWVADVGRALNVDRMLQQLESVSLGDVSSVFTAWEILGDLRVPRRRSMVRKIANAFGKALKDCPLRSFYIGFPPLMDPTWLVFNDDIERALSSVDPTALAQQLVESTPREWRQYCNLTGFATPALASFEKKVIDAMDVPALAKCVAASAAGHEYELRCLLWSLGRGSLPVRKKIAHALYETVAAAGQRSSSERPRLLEAFSPLDPHLAKQLGARLFPAGIPESKDGWRDELRRNKRDAKSLWENAIRLEKKFAQLEKSGEDYVFDPWNIDDSPDRKENVSLGTGN